MEVDEEAYGNIQQLHVAEQLGLVDGENGLDRFDFDQDAVVNQQIEAERFLTGEALVFDDDLLLADGGKASKLKFPGQTPFVNGFHQSRPLVTMHLDGRADDRLGQAGGFVVERVHLWTGVEFLDFLQEEREVTEEFLALGF